MTRRTFAAFLSLLSLLLASLTIGVVPAHADAGYDQSGWHAGSVWYEGQIGRTTVVDCQSMIIANMGTGQIAVPGTGMALGMGTEVDLDGAHPRTGEKFYLHIYGRSIGSPCGGQGFIPVFSLPPGLSLDTSSAVVCFNDGKLLDNVTCPQPGAAGGKFQSAQSETGNANSYKILCGYSQGCLGYSWPTVMGHGFEFGIPVKASQTYNGAQVGGGAWVVDPYRNGLLALTAPLNVFANTAGNGQVPGTVIPVGGGAPVPDPGTAYRITYESPSTRAASVYPDNPALGATTHGILSTSTAYTNHVPGIVVIARDTDTNQLASLSSTLGTLDTQMDQGTIPVDQFNYGVTDNVGAAYRIDYDWGDVTPGVNAWGTSPGSWTPGATYRWRVGFAPLPNGNSDIPTAKVTWGAVQTFTAPVAAATTCQGKAVTVSLALGQLPTDGADVIMGTAASETISGGPGNDTICGMGGNDVVIGGAGNDVLSGGTGNDVVIPGTGNDVARGDAGTNVLSYGDQTAPLRASLTTAQVATGAAGTDVQSGFSGLATGSGNDVLDVRNGRRDVVQCGAGRDVVRGDRSDTFGGCESVQVPPPPVPAGWVAKWSAKKGKPVVGRVVKVTRTTLSRTGKRQRAKVSYRWTAGARVVGRGTSLRIKKGYRGKPVALTVTVSRTGRTPISHTVRFGRARR